MTEIDEAEQQHHAYLQYEDSEFSRSEARKLAAYILNRYTGLNRSISQFRKYKEISLTAKNGTESSRVRFEDVVDHLIETRSFDYQVFDLTPFASNLLDSVTIQHNAPAIGVKFKLDTGIPNFPLTPTLGSEGVLFTSFQTPLLTNILRLRRTLVRNSHRIFDSQHLEWINDLRMLLNDCISIVDVTLHQLYFRAQYAPKAHWTFDAEALGNRTGVRITDKFKWIGKITGKGFDNASAELTSFKLLKNVRNHFNHFDPPCVVISIDDAVEWLNLVPAIGRLVWKIRSKLDSQLNRDLVEIILLREVRVNPYIKSTDRIQQEKDVGYRSCVW